MAQTVAWVKSAICGTNEQICFFEIKLPHVQTFLLWLTLLHIKLLII